jgi:NADH:ubiquinone oxidoreductase subunit 4 (subunit M)
MFQRVVTGELSDFLKGIGHHLTDMRPVEVLTLAPLGALVVAFGVAPGLLLALIDGSVGRMLGDVAQATPLQLAFLR